MSRLDELINDIITWQDATFPNRTIEGNIKHFKEEVQEFLDYPNDPDEVADCLMLLICIARDLGIDICEAMRNKLEKNKKRTWVDTGLGYMKHV